MNKKEKVEQTRVDLIKGYYVLIDTVPNYTLYHEDKTTPFGYFSSIKNAAVRALEYITNDFVGTKTFVEYLTRCDQIKDDLIAYFEKEK